ncbi:MAG: GNAT family N-acetyltransferase [Chlorobiales bacterium]|nr:GNAT family N-acetyltransferase [Chlorobiales bacterium]
MISHQPDLPTIVPAETDTQFAEIANIAREIWHEHYSSIVSREQIDYMLEKGYALDVIRKEVKEKGVHYDQVFAGSEFVGYAAYGPADEPNTLKLYKLYVKVSCHGKGFGKRLLEHVNSFAKQNGYTTIILQVNKKNEKAIRAYTRFEFSVREASVIDIGNGFVMDDYIMQKPV